MTKPKTIAGYNNDTTEACERVLVTLLRKLGPWKTSIYLIGGLTPRYLISQRPPDVPQHAGTSDVDIVVELEVLSDTEAYQTLEENLRAMGFSEVMNEKTFTPSKWRWKITVDNAHVIVLDFLAYDPAKSPTKVTPLPTEGKVSALNIPHASIVFEFHNERTLTAELLNGEGTAEETIRYADIGAFLVLKALAYDQRHEAKDAHDLVYCLEYVEGGISKAAQHLANISLKGHKPLIDRILSILEARFCDRIDSSGFERDGPVAVVKFENPHSDDRETRILRQRTVAAMVMELVAETRKLLK